MFASEHALEYLIDKYQNVSEQGFLFRKRNLFWHSKLFLVGWDWIRLVKNLNPLCIKHFWCEDYTSEHSFLAFISKGNSWIKTQNFWVADNFWMKREHVILEGCDRKKYFEYFNVGIGRNILKWKSSESQLIQSHEKRSTSTMSLIDTIGKEQVDIQIML